VIDKIVSLLKAWQRLTRAIESLLVDNLSATAPWAAPLIPAYMAFDSMIRVLSFPLWVSIAGAVTVEVVGLSAVSTCFQFWDYNDSKKTSEQRAPMLLALGTAIFYLAIVLTVIVLLDNSPMLHKAAKALLSTLSVCAAVILALRAGHARRLQGIDDLRIERKAQRQERHVRDNSGMLDHDILEAAQITLRRDWRTLNPDERAQVRDMSTYDIMRVYSIPDRTARQWKQLAKRNGNGHKEVVS